MRYLFFIGQLLVASLFASGWAVAADGATLPVVKPLLACEQLAKHSFSAAADAAVTVSSATLITTEQGPFCKVTGTIAPAIGFEVNLPTERWSSRFLQLGCGGLCGSLSLNLANAHSCTPALHGEFVVASTDMGHSGSMMDASWAQDPQKRIDFAYRAQHQTALVSKAIIRAYYGQPQRYAYFMGCSDGGREALMAAQRFPEDFDGIAAGAPAAFFQFQNSFFHGWNVVANQRADGSAILLKDRLPILHRAVLAHCPTLSGVADGLLQNPYACQFDPGWVPTCADEQKPGENCLTREEILAAGRLYAGASDASGRHFVLGGMPLGSELQWPVPARQGDTSMSLSMVLPALQYVLLPETQRNLNSLADFPLTYENFQRVAQLAALNNAANTNLRPFMQRGGRLILWHGLADDSVSPAFSLAYYRGVQAELGAEATDQFLRLFLLPGVGHCGRGEGYDQIDFLTPLLAWTESGKAPEQIVAAKVAQPALIQPHRATSAPASQQAEGQFHVARVVSSPLPVPGKPPLATRPVYPYPNIARYTGEGDPNLAAHYRPEKSAAFALIAFGQPAISYVGADNQRTFSVVDGKLVAASH